MERPDFLNKAEFVLSRIKRTRILPVGFALLIATTGCREPSPSIETDFNCEMGEATMKIRGRNIFGYRVVITRVWRDGTISRSALSRPGESGNLGVEMPVSKREGSRVKIEILGTPKSYPLETPIEQIYQENEAVMTGAEVGNVITSHEVVVPQGICPTSVSHLGGRSEAIPRV